MLILYNIAVNVAYYGITAVGGPWLVLLAEDHLGWPRRPTPPLRVLAVLGGACGIVLQAKCISLFHRVGRGTPSPALPPARLVTAGPYRWLRNPMNLGEMMVLLAVAAWFGSLALLLYAVIAALAFHSFVVLWEEPANAHRFGEEYLRYKAATNRWLPQRPSAASRAGVL